MAQASCAASGAVAAARFAVETVARAGVLVEIVGLALSGHLRVNFVHEVRGWVGVLLPEQPQHGAIDVGRLLQWRLAVAEGYADVAAVEHHRGGQVRDVAGRQIGHAPAEAEPDDAYLAVDEGLTIQVVHGGVDVGQDARVVALLHPPDGGLQFLMQPSDHASLPVEHGRGQPHVSLGREPVGDGLDVRVDAPDFLNHHDGGVAAVAFRLGEIAFHGAAIIHVDVNPACGHCCSPTFDVGWRSEF